MINVGLEYGSFLNPGLPSLREMACSLSWSLGPLATGLTVLLCLFRVQNSGGSKIDYSLGNRKVEFLEPGLPSHYSFRPVQGLQSSGCRGSLIMVHGPNPKPWFVERALYILGDGATPHRALWSGVGVLGSLNRTCKLRGCVLLPCRSGVYKGLRGVVFQHGLCNCKATSCAQTGGCTTSLNPGP